MASCLLHRLSAKKLMEVLRVFLAPETDLALLTFKIRKEPPFDEVFEVGLRRLELSAYKKQLESDSLEMQNKSVFEACLLYQARILEARTWL
jgi:hypothetical protein